MVVWVAALGVLFLSLVVISVTSKYHNTYTVVLTVTLEVTVVVLVVTLVLVQTPPAEELTAAALTPPRTKSPALRIERYEGAISVNQMPAAEIQFEARWMRP